MPLRLLGRQVLGSAHDRAGLGHLGGAGAGDAEVGDLGVTEVVDDHVVRLEVAVDHAVAVGEARGLEDLRADVDHALLCQRRLGGHDVLERAPREVLHRDVVGALVLAAVEDAHHVRVVEAGGRLRLAAEALHELLVLREAPVQHLDRDLPAEVAVLSAVDVRHSAGADPAQDPVAAVDERVARHLRHPAPLAEQGLEHRLRYRCRHRAALSGGALHRHCDRDARVIDRGERDEPGLRELAVRAHLGGTGLARHADAGQRAGGAGALLDHSGHHLP